VSKCELSVDRFITLLMVIEPGAIIMIMIFMQKITLTPDNKSLEALPPVGVVECLI
jgi:hypothetical protein